MTATPSRVRSRTIGAVCGAWRAMRRGSTPRSVNVITLDNVTDPQASAGAVACGAWERGG